ncbi:MAG: hypothetical protein ACRELY_08050 [Polyangiaceae bacterium]
MSSQPASFAGGGNGQTGVGAPPESNGADPNPTPVSPASNGVVSPKGPT